MSEAQVFDIQDLLLGKAYHSDKRGDGFIIQADRKGNADKWRDGKHLAAFAVRIRRDPLYNVEDYWQTIYLDLEVGA